jgi:hypothetical protein
MLMEAEFIFRMLAEDERPQVAMVAAAQKIYPLSAAERARLAFQGSRECRLILIRDTESEVVDAVFNNSLLTEDDLRSITRDRRLPEHVRRRAAKRLGRDDGGGAARAPAPTAPYGPGGTPPLSAAAAAESSDEGEG